MVHAVVPAHCAMRRITIVTDASTGSIQAVEWLHHDCLLNEPMPSRLMQSTTFDLAPGEFVRSVRGEFGSDGRLRAIAFETSARRWVGVGSFQGDGKAFTHTAVPGSCVHALQVKYGDGGVRKVKPAFTSLECVDRAMQAALTKLRDRASRYQELPAHAVDRFLRVMDGLVDALRDAEALSVASPAPFVAALREILHQALKQAFRRRTLVAMVFTASACSLHLRTIALAKLTARLEDLSTQVAGAFELHQLVRLHACAGDVTWLQATIRRRAAEHRMTDAQVVDAMAGHLPLLRLAVKHRRVELLQWLLLDLRMDPRLADPLVPLGTDGGDALYTVHELLAPHDHDAPETHQATQFLVTQVCNAREFFRRASALLAAGSSSNAVQLNDVAELVPLVTSVYDLKWIFTLTDMHLRELPQQDVRRLLEAAFDHVLAEKLVLDDAPALYFTAVLRHTQRLGYLTEYAHDRWSTRFTRVHVEGTEWMRSLAGRVRATELQVESLQSQIDSLRENLQLMQRALAEQQRTEAARLRRKQLVSLVSLLLPLASPAFAFLEQCISLCDPLELFVTLLETSPTELALNPLGDNVQTLRGILTGGAALAHLQDGLADALSEMDLDPAEFMDTLRDAVLEERPELGVDGHEAPRREDAAGQPRLTFRDAVLLYMAQRHELDVAVRESVGDDFVRLSRGSLAFPAATTVAADPDTAPTWQWYQAFTNIANVATYFTRQE